MENNAMQQVVYLLQTGGKSYVGSTSNFESRRAMHKSKAKLGGGHRVHKAIRENGLEFEMSPIVYMVGTRTEREHEEQKWKEAYGAELNERECSTMMSRDEYMRMKARERYRTDPTRAKEYARERAQHVCQCECGVVFKGPHNRKIHERTQKHAVRLQLQQNGPVV